MKILKKIKPIYLVVIGLIIVIVVILIFWFSFSHQKPVIRPSNHPITQVSTAMSIDPSGNVRVSGLVINSIVSAAINATSSILGTSVNFIIKTNSNTIFLPSKPIVGQVITATGPLESFGQTITFMAKEIRIIGNYQPNTLIQSRNFPPIATSTPAKATTTPIKTTTTKAKAKK